MFVVYALVDGLISLILALRTSNRARAKVAALGQVSCRRPGQTGGAPLVRDDRGRVALRHGGAGGDGDLDVILADRGPGGSGRIRT
jgi:hypothetical protein